MESDESNSSHDWTFNEKEVYSDNTTDNSDLSVPLINTSNQKRKRSGGKRKSCPICGLITSNAYNLSCHLRRHNNDKPFKCSKCPASFIIQQELKLHSIVHSNQCNFKCSLCSKSCKTKSAIRAHEDTHGINEYKCHYCEEKFKRFAARGKHESSVHKKGEFKCTYCYKEFASQEFKKLHEAEAHNRPKKMDINHSKQVLIESDPNSSSTKPNPPFYKCKICSERFTLRKDQISHIYDRHPQHTDKLLRTCNICGKKFTGNYYRYHMKAHAGMRPFACSLCDYKVARKGDLKIHMISHSVNGPFHCSHCGKGFKNKRSKELCEAKHKGKKEIICKICDRTFFTNFSLTHHVAQVHSKRKCEKCDLEIAVFSYRAHLRKHHSENQVKKKHSEKGISRMCDECGKCFSTVSNFKRHKETHQNENITKLHPKKALCPYCDYEAPDRIDLLFHCSLTHPTKIFNCTICTFSSLNKINYDRHTKNHMNDSSGETFSSNRPTAGNVLRKVKSRSDLIQECVICGFKSIFEFNMTEHLEKHEVTFNKFRSFNNNKFRTRRTYVTGNLKWKVIDNKLDTSIIISDDIPIEVYSKVIDKPKFQSQLLVASNTNLSTVLPYSNCTERSYIKQQEKADINDLEVKSEHEESLSPFNTKNEFNFNDSQVSSIQTDENQYSFHSKPKNEVGKLFHFDLKDKLHTINGKNFIALEDLCHLRNLDINSVIKQAKQFIKIQNK